MPGTIIIEHNPEGATPQANVTQATSGGGTSQNFSRLNSGDIGSGCTFTFSNSTPYRDTGVFYYMSQTASATGTCWAYDTLGSVNGITAWRFGFKIDNNPSTICSLLQAYTDTGYGASGGALAFTLQMTSAGRLRLRTAAGVEADAGTVQEAGAWFTVLILADASAKTVRLNVYRQKTGTLFTSISLAAGDALGAGLGSFRFGIGTAATGLVVRWDEMAAGKNDYLARNDITNQVPIASPTVQLTRTFGVNTQISCPFSATDSDGTISSVTFATTTKPSGAADLQPLTGTDTITGLTTATVNAAPKFQPASPGRWVVTASITDNSGAVATVPFAFEIYGAQDGTSTTRPRNLILANGYQPYGSGIPLTASGAITALTDNDSTTGVEVLNPNGALLAIQCHAFGPTGIKFTPDLEVLEGRGDLVWKVYKSDHTTLIGEIKQTGVSGVVANELLFTSEMNAAVPLAAPEDLNRVGLWFDLVSSVASV